MKHFLTLIISLAVSSVALAVSPKFDALSYLMLEKAGVAASRSAERMSAIVRTDDDCDLSEYAPDGLAISAIGGSYWVVDGTLADIEALAELEQVHAISLSRDLSPTNDLSAADTRVDVVRDGGVNGSSYTGRGVIAGLFDTGFDLQNPSFRRDGHSRVSGLWFYDESINPKVYTDPDKLDAFTTEDSKKTHGSHVLGTMAGYYSGSPYTGAAIDADIAVGCGTLKNAYIAAGVAKIANHARSQGKPCVINLSLSDYCGPRDGTDDFSRSLAEAVGDDVILVVSAGNYHMGKMSISRTLDDADPAIRTFIYPGEDGVASIWSADSRSFTVTPVIVDRNTGKYLTSYPAVCAKRQTLTISTTNRIDIPEENRSYDPTFAETFTDSSVYFSYASNTDSNGRPSVHISYQIWRRNDTNPTGQYGFGIIVEGEPGQRIDLSTTASEGSFYSGYLDGWTNGGTDLSISSMACTPGFICVGAHTTRTTWESLSAGTDNIGSGYTLGDIAPWSSRGTLIDGRTLPHVSAPGAAVVSVLSSYYFDKTPSDPDIVARTTADGRNNYWGVKWGTSMSSPAVAGAIACWLEADPTLKADDILDIINRTARREPRMDADPVAWGAGKFDAEAGLREVLARKAALTGPASADFDRLGYVREGSTLVLSAPCDLYDMAGRCLRRSDDRRLDVSGLTAGVYVLRSVKSSLKIVL